MAYACQLARRGRSAAPNPQVGAVIVYQNQIIGAGWHRRAGGPHAEVEALQSVSPDHQAWLPKATMYVTLEPCNHQGRTGPCTEALIQAKIPEIHIGTTDPNPEVAGNGAERLRANGMKVTVGLWEEECCRLIAPFVAYQVAQRPYVLLKYAVSADGYIGIKNGRQEKISSGASQYLVHKLRTEYDGILIGTNTAINDDPELTARKYLGESPVRIILDRHGRLSQQLRIFDGKVKTLIFTCQALKHEAVEYVRINQEDWGISRILSELHSRGIFRLMVEGGAALLQSFIDADLWDEALLIRSRHQLGRGILAPTLISPVAHIDRIGSDLLEAYFRDEKATKVNS